MAEYSRLARGSFTSAGTDKVIRLPFEPEAVEIFNYTANGTPAQYGVPKAYWDKDMGQGYAMADVFNATPVLTTQNFTVGGISTFDAGLMLQFEAQKQVVAIPKASPTVVEVTAHGYSVGDVVMFQGLYQSSTTGMPQMCGIPFRISAVPTANTFTVVWDSNQSNYTALSGSPSGAFVKKVKYPYLYEPGTNYISSITLGTTTTVVLTKEHNLVAGQEVAFRIPSLWGTTELNSLPNSLLPGSPVYGRVITVSSSTQVVVDIDSSSYTAFDDNIAVASVPGLSYPQLLAVGDLNTGGVQLSSGSPLYPPPSIAGQDTINGPAIQGAFVNNTSAGFVIGSTAVSSAVLVGASSDVIYWKAYRFDI